MKKLPTYKHTFNNLPIKVIGLTYQVDFTAFYQWKEGKRGYEGFWQCEEIDGLVLKCHNGEDVYDSFSEKTCRKIDSWCYVKAMKSADFISIPDPDAT